MALKKIALALAAMALCLSANSRTFTTVTPDKASELARSNPDEMASLRARFLAGDTTLTVDQVAYVYFLAPEHETYKPVASVKYLDDAFADQDYITALPLALKAIEGDPTSLDAIVKAIVSIRLSGAKMPDQLRIFSNRYDMLSMALLSTGAGTSLDSPFVVRNKADQFRLLNNVFEVEKIVGYCDVAGCNAAKVNFSDGGPQEAILYFRILEK